MTPMKWFWGFLRKYRFKLLLGLLMTTVISILAIVNPYVSGLIVDDVIQGGQLELLTKLVVILLLVTAVRGILRFFYQVIFETCSQGVLYDMRDSVYRRLLTEDFSFYSKKKTGDLMSRQTGDMDAIRHFVAYIIYAVYENLLLFGFALFMIFTVNVKLALCMLVVLPFTALTTYRQSKAVRPTFQRIRDRFSSLNAFVQENVSGNRVVKAFAKEDFELEKFNKENDAYMEAQLSSSDVWMKYLPIFEVLSYVLNVVLLLYGGWMVIRGEMTIGNLVTVNGYLWMLNAPLRMAGWWVNDIHRFITSVEKIYTTYVEEPLVKMPPVPKNRRHMDGDVIFKDVSYTADDEDIVKNISFSVKKGQTVGILGSTGAGKSTIMNLLCRFVDATSGEVLVDGINVKDWNLYDLRDNIGMAMQDIFLFSDTIEGNIAYGRPDCSFEEIRQAAIMADANHFIKKMPDGYDTIVGERGVGLSGGQKQRISLARALLKKPSILILDDTTSAVDMETESYIQDQLKKLDGQCTIFVIAYRISSIKDADLILVMDNGRIIEHGTHQELLAQKGYYASAFYHQYGELPSEEEQAEYLKRAAERRD
ncbi:MAG: ABC transporter ATP-binding protein [Eisenbergiella sp.]